MKRNTTTLRNFVVCIIGIVAMMMLSTPVAAATPKSVSDPVKARNSKTINQLIKAGDYFGWTSEAKTLKESAGSIKTRVEMRNSKWYYTVDVTVKMKNGRIAVDYRIKNKSYPLTSIKKMLKQYAVDNHDGNSHTLVPSRSRVGVDDKTMSHTDWYLHPFA